MINERLEKRMLNIEHNFGSLKDSPCQICIVRMLCNEPFGCPDLSSYVNKKITYIPIVSIEQVKIPRRESWLAKLKIRVRNVLSK